MATAEQRPDMEPHGAAALPDNSQIDLLSAKAALTPPTSEDMDKKYDSSSELSELESEEEDDGDFEIEPDHYWDGGKIPVFKPTMEQFRSFPKFIDKIDKYGMKSGIVKVIPPKEWRDNLPALDEMVKTIRVKNPITQEFSGTHGTYTQANIEKQRSYNLPQWKALTEELHHQPPAKRGERRRDGAVRTRATRNQPSRSATPAAAPKPSPASNDRSKRRSARTRKRAAEEAAEPVPSVEDDQETPLNVPPTPTSPDLKPSRGTKDGGKTVKIKEEDLDETPTKPRGRQPKAKSISSRRVNNQSEVVKDIDEAAFEGFDYHLDNLDEFTPERCQELEDVYWKTLNYGQPMYGADMPGSLFDESTTSWNVAKLENLLDVLGTKVPGVNTAYLYLGMWKATFAWHLEDVDLYSINYIHFGAPKQWYSISQEDARRFEAAMKATWPVEAKACDQFLRHKTFLVSPKKLESEFGIKVNRLVHYEGEFVITYPYGYHSGFNLGYNCAESVNFATEAWLNYGRIAKKCDCEPDSVWVDVNEIERKLRGEPTPEYYEETDEEEEELDEMHADLPTPPASVGGKRRTPAVKKRKRDDKKDGGPNNTKKKLRIRIRLPAKEPCILCPNDVAYDDLLPTDNGQKAHRLCAQYTVETFISDGPEEKVCNVAHIDKARLDLKCNYCRSKRGSCFQCDSRKCTRAYHATCAAAAGVLVDTGPMPYFDDDGQEYFYEGTHFRCRFHRPKRPKNTDSDALESNKQISHYAKSLKPNDVVQAQLFSGDIFAGTVVENRLTEGTVVLDILPAGDRVEVEHKYLLVLDPSDSQRPKPSSTAKPLPAHLNSNSAEMSGKSRPGGVPEKGDPFHDPNAQQKWEEFHRVEEYVANRLQQKVDLEKPERLWFYLGKTSTEARAQYTEDPSQQRHNIKSNFLDSVKPPPPPISTINRSKDPRHAMSASYPAGVNINALNGAMAARRQYAQYPQAQMQRVEKPYQYKPRPDARVQGASMPVPAHLLYAQLVRAAGVDPRNPNAAHSLPNNPNPSSQKPQQAGLPPPNEAAQPVENGQLLFPERQVDPKISKTQSPYQYYHQYYQPRSTQSNNPTKNPYHFPSNSPELQRRILPPNRTLPPTTNATSSSAISSAKCHNIEAYLAHLKQYPYLLNCYLRRPQRYVSPYAPGGGFTSEWEPLKVADRAHRQHSRSISATYQSPYSSTSTARSGSSSSPSGLGITGLGTTPSPYAGRLQFQTPQQFQQDVARGQKQSPHTNSRFDTLIQRLNSVNSSSQQARPSAVTPSSSTVSLPPHLTSSFPSGSSYGFYDGGSQSQHVSVYPKATPNRPTPSPGSEKPGNASPARPEYSPLSDAGGGTSSGNVSSRLGGGEGSEGGQKKVSATTPSAPSAATVPPPVSFSSSGAETWRFM